MQVSECSRANMKKKYNEQLMKFVGYFVKSDNV